MSKKFIPQVDNLNFVYPNNDLAEYYVDIIQNINDNSVSGSVTTFSATTVTSTGITFTINLNWVKNSADVFINNRGYLEILSIHMMAAGQSYYKPWRMVYNYDNFTTGDTTANIAGTFTVTPSQVGLTSFTNGTYNFEVRFIGLKAIYAIPRTITVSSLSTPTPTPSPTPTLTPTPSPTATSTPTPTPGGPTPTPTPTPSPTPGLYTSGATINVTDVGYIKYRKKGETVDTYVYVYDLGTYTITDCLECLTIRPGYPFADLANFTLINCGSNC